jgi:hypothetical protein
LENNMMNLRALAVAAAICALPVASAHAAVLLYSQNFESPVGFVNNGKDLSQQSVNTLYANQPVGFVFSQTFTVETMLVGGTQAFGSGYQDPQGKAGSYALSMLSSVQNDYLGMAFNVGGFDFLNFRFDLSSIDLDCCGGPFVPPSSVPSARISLFDNPGGAAGLGTGPALASVDVTGLVGPNKFTFDWTSHTVGLDAKNSTNGNVIMRIDLLTGGYAALDNFSIAASNTAGEIPSEVPEPGSLALLGLALAGLGFVRRRKDAQPS